MPKFIYTAKNKETGQTKGGAAEAKDEQALAKQLRADGFLLTSSHMEKEKEEVSIKFFDRFTSVPLKEKMVFARNLSVMISSGLPIANAMSSLALQTENKKFQNILQSIEDDIHAGNALADALTKYPNVFNDLFVNMVRVGELGGNLEEVLTIIAEQLEKEHALLSKVRGALMYPAVIVVAMIGLGVLMLTYILPQITSVFEDMEVTLPPMTQFIIDMSDLLRENSIIATIGAIFIIGFLYFYLKTPSGKRMIAWILLHLPAIENIVVKVNCARFSRIHSSLLKSGVNVTDSLAIISRTLTNHYYREALKDAQSEIQKGVGLSEVISRYPNLFPVLVYQILEVGENTGKTENILFRLAKFYEEEVDQITKNLSSIIEPVLMLVIGTAVGFFAVAMLQPMYSVLENIQ